MEEKERKKVTIKRLKEMKATRIPITALGVYDSPTAAIADRLGFEILLTGPSGPMSLFGHSDVRTIRPEEMLVVTRAVSRAVKFGLIVASLPFMTYEISRERAIETAAEFVTVGGADCVKCDANRHLAENVGAIVRAGIPVMAHIGLQASRKVEQSGYGLKGRTAQEAKDLVEDARALVEAGVFGFIAEMVSAEVTRFLRDTLPVPVLSLGSGPFADGVSIVSGDVTGYSASRKPPGARRYVDVMPVIEAGLRAYREESRARRYPAEEQTLHMSVEEFSAFLGLVDEIHGQPLSKEKKHAKE